MKRLFFNKKVGGVSFIDSQINSISMHILPIYHVHYFRACNIPITHQDEKNCQFPLKYYCIKIVGVYPFYNIFVFVFVEVSFFI